MERPDLTKDELIAILNARYTGDDDPADHPVDFIAKHADPQTAAQLQMVRPMLMHVFAQITQMQAERMLQDDPPEQLITDEEIKEKMEAFLQGGMMPAKLRQEVPPMLLGLITDLLIDFSISLMREMMPAWTYDRAWERVQVITEIAQEYSLTPVQFLTGVKESNDWVLRRTSSPEIYMERRLAVVEPLHPDEMGRRLEKVVNRLRPMMGMIPEFEGLATALRGMAPGMEQYYQIRAEAQQRAAIDIKRIWPDTVGQT